MAEKEYIERNAVIAELQEEIEFETAMYTTEQNDYFNRGLKCALKDVRSHPAADVVEVVHARWINPKNGNATCSHCQFRQRGIYDDDNEQNFCGVCGAKMDGGKHETD